jgi:hypothetical protein
VPISTVARRRRSLMCSARRDLVAKQKWEQAGQNADWGNMIQFDMRYVVWDGVGVDDPKM